MKLISALIKLWSINLEMYSCFWEKEYHYMNQKSMNKLMFFLGRHMK